MYPEDSSQETQIKHLVKCKRLILQLIAQPGTRYYFTEVTNPILLGREKGILKQRHNKTEKNSSPWKTLKNKLQPVNYANKFIHAKEEKNFPHCELPHFTWDQVCVVALCKEKNLDCSEMWCNSTNALYSGLWGLWGRTSRSGSLARTKLNCFTVVSVLILAHLSKEIGFINLIQSHWNLVDILTLNLVFGNSFCSVSLKIISN